MKTIFTIVVIVALVLLYQSREEMNETYNRQSENIGKRVVVSKDTLQIIDYNYILNQYTLDNGVKINTKFAEKTLVK